MLHSKMQVASGARRPTVARAPAMRARARALSLVVRAHGEGHGHGHGHPHGTATATKDEEKNKGFIAEMRKVAMKLHTKEQAPKEGERKAAPAPKVWTPTREGYLRFLSESKAVYDVLENVCADGSLPAYARFRKTGLERSAALAKDIAWFESTYGLKAPELAADGPGKTYAKMLVDIARSDPPAFICHYYNFYFAHTAGGRMIGSKVASMILDNKALEFYQWEGDVNVHLDGVRRSINELAESWTPEQKAHCLEVTEESFKYSGVIMQCITA